jgi:NitT/TauT family transport system substrate-binding protein
MGRARRWAAAALLLSVAACGEPVTPPLTVGMNPWVGYDPLVLARDRGLTDARQLRVVELPSASETLRHMRNGLLDAATLTLDETLRLAETGSDVRIVAVLDASTGGDVVMAAPRIATPAQLQGEFIAVEDSAVGALLLQRMLQKAGLSRADVKVTNLEVAQHLSALQSGEVAAAVSYEPLASAMETAGFRRIFDSRQTPDEILDVLVVRADVLQQRPQAVDALLNAWYAGLRSRWRWGPIFPHRLTRWCWAAWRFTPATTPRRNSRATRLPWWPRARWLPTRWPPSA